MIRGAQKKMIVLRTHNSRMFEEAYFVMRHDADDSQRQNDILSEANRILEGSLAGCSSERVARENRRKCLVRWLWFLGGFLCGSGGIGLLWWLL